MLHIFRSVALHSRPAECWPREFLALAAMAASALLLPTCARSALPTSAGWYEIPQTQLRTVCPPNNFGGTTYRFTDLCPAVVANWNSGVMDTSRNRLIVWGGGHTDYAGNEIYALNLNNLTIQRLNDPSVPTNDGGTCSVTTLPDGSPTAATPTTVLRT
jgi:hypothetical protein